ncbi:MAG TPA: sialidase family protein [Pirellulaceae bacterium]|nr:sialidase family protein [Pirellulaceae bacterium]
MPQPTPAEELIQTDVFTSGSEGYHTYRIPALVVTKKGTLLAMCEGRKTGRGDHGDLDLIQKRSTDGGQTWGKLERIHEEGGDAKITIGNPCPVVDQETGVIWLPFTRDNDKVFVTSSSDDGQTWTAPREITADVKSPDWNWYATGPGNGIQLVHGKHKGRLVIPCDHRVQGASNEWNHAGRSHVIFSDDHGQTWKLGGSTDFAMNECAVVELPGATLMLNSRSYRGKSRRGVSLSKDGGQTWEATTDDPALFEPVCQASLIRYSPDVLLFSNPADAKGRHHLTVRASNDQGKTWPRSRMICEGSSAYSSLAALPGGGIGLLYERDNYQHLTFVRFPLDSIQTNAAAK